MRILLVEDDPDLSRQLKVALADAGYAVDHAPDGEEAHFLGDTEPYDAVVLDLGLPKIDGVSVLERWRREGRGTPVLILTARGSWSDKVAGFDAGADDYLTKPFHTEELLARLRALLRRSAGHATATLSCGDLRLDPRAARASADRQLRLRRLQRPQAAAAAPPRRRPAYRALPSHPKPATARHAAERTGSPRRACRARERRRRKPPCPTPSRANRYAASAAR